MATILKDSSGVVLHAMVSLRDVLRYMTQKRREQCGTQICVRSEHREQAAVVNRAYIHMIIYVYAYGFAYAYVYVHVYVLDIHTYMHTYIPT